MQNRYIKILAAILLLVMLGGCSGNGDLSENPYSRENVSYRSSSQLFGYGRSEDIDVALEYLYDSEEASEIFGDSFQITGDKIICNTSEGHSFFLSGIYNGKAVYEFMFDDKSCKISLSKSYLGKWSVESCEFIDK